MHALTALRQSSQTITIIFVIDAAAAAGRLAAVDAASC